MDPNRITIVAWRQDGSEVRFPIGALASLKSARGSWVVTITIPQSALDALGVTGASLAFAGRIALAPVAMAADP